MATLGLTPTELTEVTGYKLPKKQIDALIVMDIPFKVRPNGSVFVARVAIAGPQPILEQPVAPIFREI